VDNLTKSLLIIDDDIGIRDGLSVLMGRYFNVETASCGKEAFEKLEKSQYDVYLIDLYLGDISGLDVLKKIKSLNKNSVAIILTAYGDETDIEQAEKLGADEFLHKPITYNKLMDVINNIFEKGEKTSNFEKYQNSVSKFIKEVSNELKVHLNIAEGSANYLYEKYDGDIVEVSNTIKKAVHEMKMIIEFLNVLSNLKNKTYTDERKIITIKGLMEEASRKLFDRGVFKRVVFEDASFTFFRDSLLNIFTVVLSILSHSDRSILRITKNGSELLIELINLNFNVKNFLNDEEDFSYPSVEVRLLRELISYVRGKINIKTGEKYTSLILIINLS
jgi:DNA-binding response OmpR family regulator